METINTSVSVPTPQLSKVYLDPADVAEPYRVEIGAGESVPVQKIQMTSKNIYDFTLSEMQSYLHGLGKEKYRAQQVFKWVYERRIENFAEMSNVSKSFREELPNYFHFESLRVVADLKSVDGTRKWLFAIEDGAARDSKLTIETVLIPNKDRLTLCVSSEVGCNMACQFCYTGKQKLKRRLTAGQIVGQFLHAQDMLKAEGRRVTNVVFMGMGEPLDNSENVFKAIEILHEPNGINFSLRKITVSTSGVVPLMPLITKSGTRLAVSLNAPSNAVRDVVMPINKRWNIYQLLQACVEHYRETRDRITFEYVLLKDVTDRLEHARELWSMLKEAGLANACKINIIPFNEHPSSSFIRPTSKAVTDFQNELMRLGAHVLLRKTMGRDIFAACGQLTSKYEGRPETMPL